LTLQDISLEGRLLVTRDTTKREMFALAPGESKEHDLTWLDSSAPSDISSDGKTVLFAEEGEGGGAGYSVYIRKTDGSPAIRLGEGAAMALSPDGKWALAIIHSTSDPQLVAYPTGAGEPRLFPRDGLSVMRANWLPDGKRIVFTASEPGHGARLYLRDFDGGKPRALSPEGYTGSDPVSPDGRWVVATGPGRKMYLYPIREGEPVPVPGIDANYLVVQFGADARSLYVLRRGELPANVYRVDVATGRREVWRTLMPADPAGIVGVYVLPTPSGDAYVCDYSRTLSDLFIVDGVK
jgi:dipeptidyl aminopeptidase/acylaminoacyl peptidase